MKLLYTALAVRCNALRLGNLTGAIKHSFTGHFINYTCPPHHCTTSISLNQRYKIGRICTFTLFLSHSGPNI